MIRLTAAAILALCVHAGLYWIDLPWSPPALVAPSSRSVSIDLVSFQKPVEKAPPVKPESIPVRPKPKPKPETKPEPKLKPKPKPAVAPVVTAPTVEPPPQPVPEATPQAPDADVEPEMVKPETETGPEAAAANETGAPENDDRAAVKASVPRYDINPPPHYPSVARRRNYQGTVVLDVQVTRDGQVAQIRIAESSGYPILDRSAVKSVKKWHFTPALRGGRPFEMWVQVPVRYALH